MFVSTTHADEKRTFTNKLQRLRCDLESLMQKVDAPYPDITETEKRRYCGLVIELLEFAVRRAENVRLAKDRNFKFHKYHCRYFTKI